MLVSVETENVIGVELVTLTDVKLNVVPMLPLGGGTFVVDTCRLDWVTGIEISATEQHVVIEPERAAPVLFGATVTETVCVPTCTPGGS